MCPIFGNMPALPSEFLLGYTADGLFEIIMRPSKFFFRKIFFLQILILYEFFDRVNSVYFFFCKSHLLFNFLFLATGPVRAFRPRSPPPPPPPPPPQPPRPRDPSPPPPPPPQPEQGGQRQVWIPLSNGMFALNDGSTLVRSNFSGRVMVETDSQGRRTVKEVGRRITKEEPIALPPFTSLLEREGRTPAPPRPPPPAIRTSGGNSPPWLSTRNPPPRPPPPQRWVSPMPRCPQSPQSPPPPYEGIIVTERPEESPPPYGEVIVLQDGNDVEGKKYFFILLFFIY